MFLEDEIFKRHSWLDIPNNWKLQVIILLFDKQECLLFCLFVFLKQVLNVLQ